MEFRVSGFMAFSGLCWCLEWCMLNLGCMAREHLDTEDRLGISFDKNLTQILWHLGNYRHCCRMAGQTSLGQRQLLLLKSHRYVDRYKAVQISTGYTMPCYIRDLFTSDPRTFRFLHQRGQSSRMNHDQTNFPPLITRYIPLSHYLLVVDIRQF